MVRLQVLLVHESVDHPVDARRRPQQQDAAEVEGVREVASRVDAVQNGDRQVGHDERHEDDDDRLQQRDLALKSRRAERAARVHRLSAAPHQQVDAHVAVEEEDGGDGEEGDLLEDAGETELGVAHERAEHDALVEDDLSAGRAGSGAAETRQRRREYDEQRRGVDDAQHGGDGARTLEYASGARVHDDEVAV